MKIEIIGYIATLFTMLSILPNMYSVIIQKSTYGFKYEYMTLSILAKIAWIIFSLYIKNIPLIITSSFLLICYSLILFFKFYYEKYNLNLMSIKKC
jgi:uncharacterized protein with PQ loop repeat